MRNIAKIMSVVSFCTAFLFFTTFKGGIGEIEAPKDFLKK